MKLLFLAVCVSLNVLFSAGQEGEVDPNQLDSFLDAFWSTTTEGSNSEHSRPEEEGEESHTTVAHPECKCIPYYQCHENNTANIHGEGLIDIRFKPESKCEDYLESCCPVDSKGEVSTEPPTPPPSPHGPEGHPPTCGQRNEDGVGFRITGALNNEAQFGEFPWMVAVLNEGNAYQCGASLISPKVVLTAAHCVHQKTPSTLKVRAGEWDTQTKNELFPHIDNRVQDIIIHEDYKRGGLQNNVALLILEEPFEFKENINFACLPEQDAEYDEPECFATGWGKDVFGKEGKYQVILKKVDLPIVPRSSCQSALRRTRLGAHFQLHESFICAGGEKGKDTCKGDGGSPLVCPMKSNKHIYAQVGIVAWGIGCGEDGTPGVYVNVAKFRHWIDAKINEHNLDTSAYQYSP